jgi:hypothetical protein
MQDPLDSVGNWLTDPARHDQDAALAHTPEGVLALIYAENAEKASVSILANLFSILFGWLAFNRYDLISTVMSEADFTRLAPEIQVGLLRATGRFKTEIAAWAEFFTRTEQDLRKRGKDPVIVLRGLS